MRVQTLIIFLLGAATLHAQIINCEGDACTEVSIPKAEDGSYQFQQVIDVPGATQGELYSRAKVMFAELFKDASEVIQSDDATSYTIVGKAWSPIDLGLGSAELWYTIKVEAKPDRYRYTIYDMIYDGSSKDPSIKIVYREPIEQAFFETRIADGKRKFKDQKIRAAWLSTINNLQQRIIDKMSASASAKDDAW